MSYKRLNRNNLLPFWLGASLMAIPICLSLESMGNFLLSNKSIENRSFGVRIVYGVCVGIMILGIFYVVQSGLLSLVAAN